MRQLIGQHVKVHVGRDKLAVTWPVSDKTVYGYCDDVLLWDCLFRPGPDAYVTGWVRAIDTGPDVDLHEMVGYQKLRFDPDRDAQFMTDDEQPVAAAMWVLCAAGHAYANLREPTNRPGGD